MARWTRRLAAGAAASSIAWAALGAAQSVPIVQPGAPGQAGRVLTADEAARYANRTFVQADLDFMAAMIHHHAQALEMTDLAKTRTSNKEVLAVAARIAASQKDEMKFMREWLAARGQSAAADAPMAAMPGMPDMMMMGAMSMKGMATPAQMAALAAAKGVDFDRMFLKLMSAHHEGAVQMVEDLLHQQGAAYDPVLFQFTSDVSNEQTAEIKRMAELAATLSTDPRDRLKAGFRDAGIAASNMALVTSLPRPAGFFDPQNPADLPPPMATKGVKASANLTRVSASPKPAAKGKKVADAPASDRWPLNLFMQSDMAFRGDTLFVGNFHGINMYRLGTDGVPVHAGSLVCPGGQDDVSVVGNLLIASVEMPNGRVDCGTQGVKGDVSKERFRGIRIYDISDLANPRQVGQVQTCRGSHTHSVVKGPEGDGKILVYVSGTAGVRKAAELAGCVALPSANSSRFRIDIVEIPVANPAAARIVDSPAVFADLKTGELAGLWQGGNHGDGTQETSVTDQCHDITVFPSRKLAAGACSGNGILLDISDPRHPKRIDAVTDPGFAYWHSATFNNDGTKVIFTDEWGGGMRPRCQISDPRNYGADALYDMVDGKLVRRGTYKLPSVQTETENCVAHNGSIVPVPGRDIMVQAWYQGGISVFDFTDATRPTEIASFDRGPMDAKRLVLGGDWSAYYYKGKIYATEIIRGLDVLELKPSASLSANEIAAAALASYNNDTFNPQDQHPVSWPAVPVVARAYADQLRRGGALDASYDQRLAAALAEADTRLGAGGKDGALAARLKALAAEASTAPADAARHAALAAVLGQIAARLS
ncbi:DUF305 domain-containing protein [Sphingomonas sp. ASV193]|uniref:DUF305 domain-containing protein n=1 Tax=Sphingomonas sp. ASV193 TaxID=3144405 RepID=UPI0032E8EABC